nr:hypothetical protein CFP56_46215 [Quercus suber]
MAQVNKMDKFPWLRPWIWQNGVVPSSQQSLGDPRLQEAKPERSLIPTAKGILCSSKAEYTLDSSKA